jgi:hypothetical protein
MNSVISRLGFLLAAGALACGSAPDRGEGFSETLQLAAKGDDQGTGLSATAEASAPVCLDESSASVTISGVLTTTGSVDSAEITVGVDGGEATPVGTIEPGDFDHDGNIKTADYSFDLVLAEGAHTVEVCFTQSGSGGREPKFVCAPVVIVVVDCSPEATCDPEGVFGDLVGNPVLCSGGGTPHVPVHLRGDFGEDVVIAISGPEGFTLEDMMNHAGASCIYQYNWDTRSGNHGGPGSYTFVFVGDNGNSYEFTRDLSCND